MPEIMIQILVTKKSGQNPEEDYWYDKLVCGVMMTAEMSDDELDELKDYMKEMSHEVE